MDQPTTTRTTGWKWVLSLTVVWCVLLVLGNIGWSLIIFPEIHRALSYSDIHTDLQGYHFWFGLVWESLYLAFLIACLINFSRRTLPVWVTKALIILTVSDAVVWLSMMEPFTLEHATGAIVGFAVASKFVTIPLFTVAAVVEYKMRRRRQQADRSAA